MAWRFPVVEASVGANQAANFLYTLKEQLKAYGGTVRSSSDGLASFGAGDHITGSGAGAGGLNNSRAYVVITWQGVDLGMQRGSGGAGSVWIKASVAGLTVGGDATNMPTAADQQNVFGSTTAGTSLGCFATSWFTIFIDDEAPYGWYAIAFADSTGDPNGVLTYIPLATGSFPTEDTTPFLFYASAATNAFDSVVFGATTIGPRGWYRYGEVDVAWANWGAEWGDFELSGVNAWGRTPLLPFVFMRLVSDTPPGTKGIPEYMYVSGPNSTPNKDTFSVAPDTRSWISVNEVALPWNGSVPGHLTAASTDHAAEILYGPTRPGAGAPALTTYYFQRVYDTVVGWCYFTKTVLDSNPAAGETSPNHTNNLRAGSHALEFSWSA